MNTDFPTIHALIIDDHIDYYEGLKINARSKNIILKTCQDLESGMEFIRENTQIQFVILDGKCFANADQIATNTTVSNIPVRAKAQIDEINREQNRFIQYCVNTGFYDDLHSNFDGVFDIFEKGNDEKLLNYLIEKVTKGDHYKLLKKYHTCFVPFELGIIDKQYEYLLFDILKSLESGDYKKKNCNTLRDLLEATFIGLIAVGCIPDSFLNEKSNPNLEWCTRFLEGRETEDSSKIKHKLAYAIPQEIKSSFRKLKEATSERSHLTDDAIVKYPFLANTYCMLEILEWLPEFIKANYE